MTDARAKYRALCEAEAVPLFGQAWWLDTVAGPSAWDVVLVERGGQVHAALPYLSQRRFGLTLIGMPPLTRSIGPWLRELGGSQSTRIGREAALVEELLTHLPEAAKLRLRLHPGARNVLPWLWSGHVLTPRVTYVLDPLSDEASLWKGLSHGTRDSIKKARNRHAIRVEPGRDFGEFLSLHREVFTRQGLAIPHGEGFLRGIDQACVAHDARDLWIARDASGKAHAAAFIVRDRHTAYYLMSGSDAETRSNGAMSLVLWHAILASAARVKAFDFEGSMIPSIEQFFRSFGARQSLYFEATRVTSRVVSTLDALRRLRRPDAS